MKLSESERMILMDIQGINIATTVLSNNHLPNSLNMALMDKALEIDQANGDALMQMIEQSVTPWLGQNIDIRL